MKIVYKEPSIIDKINDAISHAKYNNKEIDCIELSATELSEYCELSGYAFSKNCGYTYKHYRIKYDWSSYR